MLLRSNLLHSSAELAEAASARLLVADADVLAEGALVADPVVHTWALDAPLHAADAAFLLCLCLCSASDQWSIRAASPFIFFLFFGVLGLVESGGVWRGWGWG